MTVTIENTYTGNGSTTDYSFTFPYLDTPDIKASLAGINTTAFTLLNATTVRFSSAPGNGVAIRIFRDTDFEAPKATFYPGSAIRASDLNDNALQNLYVNQESNDKVADAWLTGDPTVISTETWHTSDDTKIATTKAIEGRIDTKIDSALVDDIAAGSSIAITDNSPSSGKVTIGVIASTGSNSGSMSASDKTKLDNIESNATADQTNAEIRAAVEAASDSNVFTDADHSKLNAIEASATADQTNAEIRAAVEAATDSNVFTDADHSKLNAIETSATADQTASEIKTLLQSNKLTDSEIATGTLDNRYYTKTESDAAYFNVSTGDTIKDGDTFPDNDTTIATTAAINDRIIDLVDDVGGFVPIANETSFPNANPDVNNGAGTLVSIKALSSNVTSNGSGVATISNGTVGNSTVTINGLANSTTYAATFGMIVETTTTLNTYTFHRLVPKATEVTTVAGSISNVNTVAGAISNVNSVASNATNINTVAGINANVTTVAGNNSNITTVAGNNTNINTVAGANSNISTVAGAVTNVNNVGGSIANVNTVATNISGVNDFADRYRVASSDPGSNNDTGDLVFNTTSNELRVYNGSAWQGGVTATGSLLPLSGGQMTGNLTFSGSQTVDGRDVSADGSKLDGIATSANNYTHPNHSGEVTSTADGATVIADNVVDEANLKVSNSPTNGQFLQAQSGNTGGLTWATPTTYTHPNHSGEVTSSADGAQTIADNVVDEANLKVSNSPTNGYALTAQSGNTGGLTWAEIGGGLSSDAQGNTVGGTNAGDSFTGTDATKNTLLGYDAGTAITTGDWNIALGHSALKSATTAGANIAIGYEAAKNLSSATGTTFIGWQAANNGVLTGAYNVGVGYSSGYQLTTGYSNVFLGTQAGYGTTTGYENTYIGQDAGGGWEGTGNNNIAVGHNCMQGAAVTGAGNIGMGQGAFNSLTSGTYNVAIGYEALNSIDGASKSVAIGYRAGKAATNYTTSVFIGEEAGIVATSGGGNVMIGRKAGHSTTSPSDNTFIGNEAGQYNELGHSNTGIGFRAFRGQGGSLTTGVCWGNTGVGRETFQNITTGFKNFAGGLYAGTGTTTGNENTFLGYAAGYDHTTADNCLLLGNDAGRSDSPSGTVTTTDGVICLGNNLISNLYCADTSISSSDSRDKTDVTNFTHGLDWVNQLIPITYRWDKRSWYDDNTPDGSKKRNKKHIGFLAQAVLAIEGNPTDKDDMLVVNLNEDDSAYGLKYERLIPVLVNAIKELSAKVTALEAK